MALSRRGLNNILIFVSLGMLILFQTPLLEKLRGSNQPAGSGASSSALIRPWPEKPLVRLELPGLVVEHSADGWQATPPVEGAARLAERWQGMRWQPLASGEEAAIRALLIPPMTALVWLADEPTPRAVRMATDGQRLLLESGDVRGYLPLSAASALVPGWPQPQE